MKLYSVQVGTEKFQIEEGERQQLSQLIDSKQRGMFTSASGSFLIEKVNSIKPLNFVDYHQEEAHREYVSDEQRLKNSRRMRIAKLWMQSRKNRVVIPTEDQSDFDKFSAWMDGKAQRRQLRSDFRQEFYDVYFEDDEELEYCYQSWLPFHDGSRDPRDYKRQDHTPEALGLHESNSILKESQQVFRV